MVHQSAVARRHLDARLRRIRPVLGEQRPPKGWIRAIRDALGMSSTELAARMGVAQPRVPGIERGELDGTIRLDVLRRAAEAMDCELAYFLVPRTTLDQAVRTQARRKAARHLAPISHHMRLEDQEVSEPLESAQLDDLATQFIDRRGLWSEQTTPK